MALPPPVDVLITVADFDVTPFTVFTQTNFQVVASAQPGTCTITLREQALPGVPEDQSVLPPVLPPEGSVIRLYLDGELKWTGYLFSIERGYFFDADVLYKRWILGGVDLNILFDKLILYNHAHPTRSLDGGGTYTRVKTEGGYVVTVPQHTMDRDYLIAMLQDTDIDLISPVINTASLISEIAQINPDGKFTPPTPGLTLRAFMQNLSANIQRSTPGSIIWYINQAGYLIWREQDIDIAPFSVGDTDPNTSVMVKNLRMTTDISRIKNDVLMFTGNLNPDPNSTQSKLLYRHSINQDSVDQYGRFQYSEVLSTSWLQGSIDVRAAKLLAQEGTPSGRADFTIYEPGLYPGMLVNIFADAHGVAENYPVRSIDIGFLTPTTVEYRVTCSFDTQDPWGLLLALKRPPVRGLVQPPFQVIDRTKGGTVQPADTYTLVKEYPTSMSGNRWQCSYAYIRYSMVVYLDGLRKINVPEEGTTVGFLETDPDNGIFFMDAAGKPYVEYHVWHNLDNQ
jgi:hypothetical protein